MSNKISVILPVYQVEDYIENTLKSILKQSFLDFELIIVNDGSYDNSIKICKAFLESTDLCWKIIDQKNSGLAAARNMGIKNARGEWVICVDSDDVINEIFLEMLYIEATTKNVNIAFCDFQIVKNEEIFKQPSYHNSSLKISNSVLIEEFLLRKTKILAPSMLINREFLVKKNLLYNENCKFSEDAEYIWRLLFSQDWWAHIRVPLYNYLLRPNSIMTASSIPKIETGYIAMKRMIEELQLTEKYDFKTINWILPRWVMGALRGATRMMNEKDFLELCYNLEYKTNLKKILDFPDKRVCILARLLKFNAKLFYKVARASLDNPK